MKQLSGTAAVVLIALSILAVGRAQAQTGSHSLSNSTLVVHEPSHGTQIEYFHPGGHAFLWYPGNTGVVQGRWKLETQAGRRTICFRYGPNTYNPVTRQRGGQWQCRPFRLFARGVVSACTGDVFRLSNRQGAVPHVLKRDRRSLSTYTARCGG